MFKNHLSRRKFLKTTGLAASALLAGTMKLKADTSDNKKRPNIIFIMSDDHAANAISCYGSKINKTPNIDRIAAEGMKFDNCFCTNSICAPSRAVILTGKYSHINGVRDNRVRFDSGQQTFPKLLRKAGYQRAMIGKWHLKSKPTGFDYYNVLPGQGHYHNPTFIEMGQEKKHSGYVTDLITDFSIDWLKNRGSDKPFLLMCHHKAPHRNWKPDEKHADMYKYTEIPKPDTFNDDYKKRCAAARQKMTIAEHLRVPGDTKVKPPENLNEKELINWKYQRYIKDYLRCVAAVDDNVGRLLAYLDKSGLAENTIVVYTSDQGFFLGEHGWFDKRFMYEESMRMPLLVRYPEKIKPGSVNDDIVLNLDFAPTFLDFAGLEKPPDMQGSSLKPLLKGRRPKDWRDAMYYHYYEYPGAHSVKRHYGIRTRRYKMIHFYYDIDAWELFDLKKDPKEMNNVYAEPEYAYVAATLKQKLRHLQKKYGDSDELAAQLLKQETEKFKEK